jgi:hypothetical protein
MILSIKIKKKGNSKNTRKGIEPLYLSDEKSKLPLLYRENYNAFLKPEALDFKINFLKTKDVN